MNLPDSFIRQIKDQLKDESDAFLQAMEEPAPLSIRLNPAKPFDRISWEKRLEISLRPLAWSTQGFYLDRRPSFTLDPLFHAGAYYVQEASSMKLESMLSKAMEELGETADPLCVLDLCAAPGGKSTHLASLLPSSATLVSNEFIRNRALVLRDNMTKWGKPAQMVSHNSPAEIGEYKACFDLITADVPCSGEGMFRKDPASIAEWSPESVLMCAQRQKDIIRDVWPALKAGGFLIYSTCTYNAKENEENTAWICSELGAELLMQEHCYPHVSEGEGFFIALMRKSISEEACGAKRRPKDRNVYEPIPKSCAEVKNYICKPETYRFHFRNPDLIALPLCMMDAYEKLRPHLRILSAGIKMGEIKGKDFIPDHALALSNSLDPNRFAVYDCNEEEALRYLRMDNFLADGMDPGFVLIRYEGLALGWAKHLGKRTNNLLPKELRVRMSKEV